MHGIGDELLGACLVAMAGKNIGLDLSIIGPRVAAVGARHEPRMASPGSGPPGRRLRTAVGLALTAALLFAVPVQVLAQEPTPVFDADAEYRILTRYRSATEIDLADYLAAGATGITFSLESCDSDVADYYDSAEVASGKLVLTSNILGHVHGTGSHEMVQTKAETVCTVRGTRTDSTFDDQMFELYTVPNRRPTGLAPGSLSVVEVRAEEVDVQITTAGSSSYVRLAWRKDSTGLFTAGLVSGVSSSTTLTIPGLEDEATYQIIASLMNRQSFDLYRDGTPDVPGTLITEGNPDPKWRQNLSGAGLGASDSTTATTLMFETTAMVSIAPATTTVFEGGSVEVTVTLSAPLEDAVTVPITHPGTGTATDVTDYSGVPADVTFAKGHVQETFTLTAIDDGAADSGETVIIGFGTLPPSVTAGTSVTSTVTIADKITVSITPATATVAEGATQVITVTLSASFATDKDIPLTISGTAKPTSPTTAACRPRSPSPPTPPPPRSPSPSSTTPTTTTTRPSSSPSAHHPPASPTAPPTPPRSPSPTTTTRR